MAVVEVPEELNLAALHEAIAASVPERECIVWRDRRLTWADVTDRTRRLSAVLRAAGLEPPAPGTEVPGALPGWESPHAHVALYLHNGNEYLEGMLGSFKARCAPVNVNYRYVAEELRYVLADCAAQAVIYHGAFAHVLAEVLPDLPQVRLLLQVADATGADLLPGAVAYEDALAAATPAAPEGLTPDDRYVLYTGGTTGMPKGALWRQADFLAACLGIDRTTESIVERARRSHPRVLAAPPFMHGAAHWNAISAWMAGGTVVIQDHPARLDADDLLRTLAREQATSLLIVGDAFARPLVDALRTGRHDVGRLRHLLTGGAILSAPVKEELLALVPGLRIVDILGSSETGRQGVQTSDAARGATTGTFEPSPTTAVLSEDLGRVLAPGDEELGWLAQSGRVPLGYLGDAEKTRRTFPTIAGVRYAVAGDRARLRADGSVELHGRDSVTINTGGEKVFAEEVEQALKHHPAVFDAVVVGRPSDRWGQEVVAVVSLREDVAEPSDDELCARAADHVARYKLPKAVVRVPVVERSPSGKPDYRWAAEVAVGKADGLGGLPPTP